MAKGLGKGLDALFEDTDAAYERLYEHRSAFDYTEEERKNAEEMSLDKISANPNQPRKNFDEQALRELSDSIKKHGVIMPIVVNDNKDGSYMIIAGERRYRGGAGYHSRGYKELLGERDKGNFPYRKFAERGP